MFGSTEIPEIIDEKRFKYASKEYTISDIIALDYSRESVTSSIYFIPYFHS